MNDYFRQGYNEYILGYDLTHCPFHIRNNAAKREQWRNGWLKAEIEEGMSDDLKRA
jgi:ribosome modulation factor